MRPSADRGSKFRLIIPLTRQFSLLTLSKIEEVFRFPQRTLQIHVKTEQFSGGNGDNFEKLVNLEDHSIEEKKEPEMKKEDAKREKSFIKRPIGWGL